MDPVKYAIYHEINKKCGVCSDFSFCKLPEYYHKLENPDIKDLLNIKKCLFFKKDKITLKIENSWL